VSAPTRVGSVYWEVLRPGTTLALVQSVQDTPGTGSP